MEDKIYFEWSNLDLEWIDVEYTWIDVAIARKVEGALGGNPLGGIPSTPHKYIAPQQIIKTALDGKEYRRFINLVCKVNGISSHSLKERKPECKITLTEIRRTLNEVLRPQIKITNIYDGYITKSKT